MATSVERPAIPVVPRHVAIIMDGNGRWAQQRGRPRTFGHGEGVEALRRTVEAAADLGVRYLTVYSFSTENWSRPPAEISALFDLLRLYVGRDLDRLHQNNVKVRFIGDRAGLESDILSIMRRAEALTADNDALELIIAFNYGGQDELARAVRRIAQEVAAGALAPAAISPGVIAGHLDTAGVPDPDLVIRTSGEQRLSNFLLWQAAYAEFVFVDTLWPDFDREALVRAIEAYARRVRRFGASET
jgi:undecaprenyl diphosphate synthase